MIAGESRFEWQIDIRINLALLYVQFSLWNMVDNYMPDIDLLAQSCGNSCANALELPQSWAKLYMCSKQ